LNTRLVKILTCCIGIGILTGCASQRQLKYKITVIKQSGDTSYFDDFRKASKTGYEIGLPRDPVFIYVVGTDTAKYKKISKQRAWKNTNQEAVEAFEAYEDSLNRSILSEIITEEDMGIWDNVFKNIINAQWRQKIYNMLDTCLIEVGWEVVWDKDGAYRSNILGKFHRRNISVYWVDKINRILDAPDFNPAWRTKIKSTITFREESRLADDYLNQQP